MATTPTDRRTALARRLRVDIDTATFPASQYQQLMAIQELKIKPGELRTESDEGYEDDGAMREAVTGYSWGLEIKLKYSTNAAGDAVDPVHLFLFERFKAVRNSNVALGEFGIRWYDRTGLAGDAHEGRAYVKAWPPDGGNSGALDTVSIVIQGQGPVTDITNPMADMDPVVTGLSPATGDADGGNLVNVYGTHLATASGGTGVKFGATNATEYTVISDSHIVAVAPAGAAGTAAVTVTTPEGTSANTAADDYVYTA